MTRRAWGLLGLFFGILLVAPFAHGQTGVLAAQSLTGFAPVAGGGYVRVVSAFSDPVTARIWATATGAITATDAVAVTARAGPLVVSSVASVNVTNAAAAVARCLVGGGPVICGVGSAAAAAYGAYRIYRDDTFGLRDDPGQPAVVQTQVACTINSYVRHASSAPEACMAAASRLAEDSTGAGANGSTNVGTATSNGACTGTSSGSCPMKITTVTTYTNGTTSTSAFLPTGSWNTANVPSCTASIDALDPANNVPAGSPVGPDGKCPTARYNHQPTTAALAQARVTSNPSGFPSVNWRDALRDAINTGGQSTPATINTTGPSSQVGAPTTTTTTSGGVTTTKTTTPTYNYTYNTTNINTTTTTTTTTNNGGAITTETTNAPPADDKDPCLANPGRAGCPLLGTPPTDAVTWQEKPVTYAHEAGIGVAGSCPPDRNFMFASWAMPLKYKPACDAAPFARIAILVCAAISAAALITRTVTS
jgi:hypothetical protein